MKVKLAPAFCPNWRGSWTIMVLISVTKAFTSSFRFHGYLRLHLCTTAKQHDIQAILYVDNTPVFREVSDATLMVAESKPDPKGRLP